MALAVVVSAATVGLTMFGALDLLGRSHTRSLATSARWWG